MASGTWSTGFWGQNQWNDSANASLTVTGIALTANLGTTTEVTGEINSGWGRLGWGINGWNIAGTFIPTGVAGTFSLGSVTTKIDVTPTIGNFGLTATLASVSASSVANPTVTGIAMTSTLANVDAGPDAMATGNAATMALGTIDAFNQTGWGRQGWNVNAWGVEGQFATALVSGNNITATPGTLTASGDANLTANTLNVIQATLGSVDPAPDAFVTGNAALLTLGTLGMRGDVSPSVTGIAMTATLGNETIDLNQEFTVTGQAMIARLSSGFSAFTDVTATFNGFGLTMTQGSGSALIWNEVNTGSAPITPPGWREVAA
jgi:hypothetical protein